MWRLLVAVVLSLTTLGWPTATGTADAALAQPAVGSLEADFNADGFVDLAVGAPFEDIGAAVDPGAINVLYGSAGGLTAARSQAFWQGAGGAAGTAEAGDQLGLVSGDLSSGTSTAAGPRSRVDDEHARQRTRAECRRGSCQRTLTASASSPAGSAAR